MASGETKFRMRAPRGGLTCNPHRGCADECYDAAIVALKQVVPDLSDQDAMLETVQAVHYASMVAPKWPMRCISRSRGREIDLDVRGVEVAICRRECLQETGDGVRPGGRPDAVQLGNESGTNPETEARTAISERPNPSGEGNRKALPIKAYTDEVGLDEAQLLGFCENLVGSSCPVRHCRIATRSFEILIPKMTIEEQRAMRDLWKDSRRPGCAIDRADRPADAARAAALGA
jgi:hypothetical protein